MFSSNYHQSHGTEKSHHQAGHRFSISTEGGFFNFINKHFDFLMRSLKDRLVEIQDTGSLYGRAAERLAALKTTGKIGEYRILRRR